MNWIYNVPIKFQEYNLKELKNSIKIKIFIESA